MTNPFRSVKSVQSVCLLLLVVWMFTACDTTQEPKTETYTPTDTTESIKIDNHWVTAKKSFEFGQIAFTYGDTIHFVTCSQFVYFPFGELKSRSSLKGSLLGDFKIVLSDVDSFYTYESTPDYNFRQWTETLELELGENRLNLVFDSDPEATIHSYIRGGQILDNKVKLTKDIKVGMSNEHFFNIFFDYFPAELINKYKVVELESCVTDIIHFYRFEDEKLNAIEFFTIDMQ